MGFILLIIIVLLFTVSVGLVIEERVPTEIIIDDKVSDDVSILYKEVE